MAYDICKELKPTLWKFYKDDHHLLHKQQSFFQTARFDQIQSWEQAVAKSLKNAQERVDKSSGKLTKWIISQLHTTTSHTTSIMVPTLNQHHSPIMQSCVAPTKCPKPTHQTFFNDTHSKRSSQLIDPNFSRGPKMKLYQKGHEKLFHKHSKYGRKKRGDQTKHHLPLVRRNSKERGRQLNM